MHTSNKKKLAAQQTLMEEYRKSVSSKITLNLNLDGLSSLEKLNGEINDTYSNQTSGRVHQKNPANNNKKALVLNLESTLIDISTEQLNKHYHPIETKAETGSSTVFAMKRPGLEEFLSELQAYYHIYIYTHVEGTHVKAICQAMGISPYISEFFSQESFITDKDTTTMKCIEKLGLSASHSIIIDDSSKYIKNQPDNGILIKTFNGDTRDRELHDVQGFLKHMATLNEVRPVVEHLFDYFQSEKFQSRDFDLLAINKQFKSVLDIPEEPRTASLNKNGCYSAPMRKLKTKMSHVTESQLSKKSSYKVSKTELIGRDILSTLDNKSACEEDNFTITQALKRQFTKQSTDNTKLKSFNSIGLKYD